MNHILVTTFIVILAGAHSCFSEGMSERVRQISEQCFAKSEIALEDQQKLIESNFVVDEPEPSIMCFAKCAMEEWGVLKDGALDEVAVMATFAPVFGAEKLGEMIEECKNEQGDAPCETEFKMFSCFKRLAGTKL